MNEIFYVVMSDAFGGGTHFLDKKQAQRYAVANRGYVVEKLELANSELAEPFSLVEYKADGKIRVLGTVWS